MEFGRNFSECFIPSIIFLNVPLPLILSFALAVEPDNKALCDYAQWVAEKRAQGQPTLPSNLKEQKNINPFLRAHELSVKTAAEAYCENNLADDVAVFAAVRRWKDEF